MRGFRTLLANGGVLRALGEPVAGAAAEDAPPTSGVARFELR
jgi:hypothetical protein